MHSNFKSHKKHYVGKKPKSYIRVKINGLAMSARNLVLVNIIIIFYSCDNRNMNKEDAVRSLKVLNSDLVNFGNRISESPEMTIWSFLMEHRDAPIPFYKNSNHFITVKEFHFEEMKGIYHWNSGQKIFVKTSASNQIVIFPDTTQNSSVRYIISDYNSRKVSSGEQFPTSIKITIEENGDEFWRLDYHAGLADELPENIELSIRGNDYKLQGTYLRTRSGDDGTLNLGLSFIYLTKTLLNTQMDCTIGYSLQGYYLKTILLDQAIFNHKIYADVDYASIDPTAENYTDSFNSHCKSSITEKGKGRIGELILAGTENDELNDFFIRFADNSTSRMGDFLPVCDKFLNLKY